MAINFPGPFELRIPYTIATLTAPVIEHVQRLNIDLVGTPAQADVFSNYDVVDKDGDTTIALSTWIEAYLALFNALFDTSMDVGNIELWKYPTAQSFDSVFWSSYTPTANAGTGAGAPFNSGQVYHTFRTAEGGILKISLMEALRAAGSPVLYGSLSAAEQAFIDFVLDGDGATYSAVILARDTSYPIAYNKAFPGQNEAVFKKRFRA